MLTRSDGHRYGDGTAMTEQDLLDAVGQGESFGWEFKSARGGVPGSIWDTYSAMANTLGGTIVLGVDEKDGVFSVTGLPDPAHAQKSIWDTLNDRGKISANLCRNDDVRRLAIGASEVLVIRVRQAFRRERPIYIGQNRRSGPDARRPIGVAT
ncbi:MAG: ATP-binding protein [Armatimonadota bacterium]|nr:ATP-binding protein [Armatimonadota bacterium]